MSFAVLQKQVPGWHLMNMPDAIKADRDLVLLAARPSGFLGFSTWIMAKMGSF